MKKKLMSLMLSLCMLISCAVLPSGALAEETSGTHGGGYHLAL